MLNSEPDMLVGAWGVSAQFLVFYRIWAKLTEWIVFVIMYV